MESPDFENSIFVTNTLSKMAFNYPYKVFYMFFGKTGQLYSKRNLLQQINYDFAHYTSPYRHKVFLAEF